MAHSLLPQQDDLPPTVPAARRRITCLQPVVFPRLYVIERMARSHVTVIGGMAQLSRAGLQTRYFVKYKQAELRLSIPVLHTRSTIPSVNEATIAPSDRRAWKAKHLRTIQHCYRKAPYFDAYFPEYKELIDAAEGAFGPWALRTMRWSVERLGIEVTWMNDHDVCPVKPKHPSDWVVAMCRGARATSLYCGRVGFVSYMRPDDLSAIGVEAEIQRWWPVPTYRQVHGAFVGDLSVLDLLFNMGRGGADIFKDSLALR